MYSFYRPLLISISSIPYVTPFFFSLTVKPALIALPLARHIAILNQTGTSVSVRCGKCSKPLQRSAASVTASISGGGSAPSATPHAAWACGRHPSAETALSTCAVCHMTVRGIYLWCIGCSHGGHLDHIRVSGECHFVLAVVLDGITN